MGRGALAQDRGPAHQPDPACGSTREKCGAEVGAFAASGEQVAGDLVDQGLPGGESPDLVAGQRERAKRGTG